MEFLLEHTRKPLREEIKEKAADFGRRYDDLLCSLQTYVGNLEVYIYMYIHVYVLYIACKIISVAHLVEYCSVSPKGPAH